eukprot:jgi/Chlat1/6835/Chrsp51S06526
MECNQQRQDVDSAAVACTEENGVHHQPAVEQAPTPQHEDQACNGGSSPIGVEGNGPDDGAIVLSRSYSMKHGALASVAATRIQRLYRGYRVRRELSGHFLSKHNALWWPILESARLLASSSSRRTSAAGDIRSEIARSNWQRSARKAAVVGRGLSQDEFARQLSLEHWLEAVDSKHRYGHNLHIYYKLWLDSPTQEPFFYWLDCGEGVDVESDECSREKLRKQLIAYLGPGQRSKYQVDIIDGRLVVHDTGAPLVTQPSLKYIFVMDTKGTLYVHTKQKGIFQHSSFLSGGAAVAAGRLETDSEGKLKRILAHSGHYKPTRDCFEHFIEVLKTKGVDLNDADMRFATDDDPAASSLHGLDFIRTDSFIVD